jgi:aminomethyltransferase
MDAKKTSIVDYHVKHNGRMVDFAGWYLPVEYSGLRNEHNAVRTSAGIFDVSHMGEVFVKGKRAGEFVQHIVCNDISKMYDGRVLYSPMCYENGGIVDDLIVYKMKDDFYLLVVNASNTEKDFEWFKANNKFGVTLENVSPLYFQLAVQGPKARYLVESACGVKFSGLDKFFHFTNTKVMGVDCIVSRTGYTGEDGLEIYGKWNEGGKLWEKIVQAGATPCGLGCRDTLRLEAALPLYGNDITQDTTPLEAGLDLFVKLQKSDFIGKKALVDQKSRGLKKRLIGFTLEDRNIPRHGYAIEDAKGKVLGEVTSGTFSPTLGIPIGLAYVDNGALTGGEKLFVNIRKKGFPLTQAKLPFVKKSY